MKLVIAATGASGTIYLQRLLEQIDTAANEVHLIMSGHAKQVAAQEVDELRPEGVAKHPENDVVDTLVWRILDQFGLPNTRAFRWKDDSGQTAAARN